MNGASGEMNAVRRVGARFRALREQRGLTQAELAGRIGRSVNAMSALERGVNKPTFDVLQRLAGALGVPVGDFFSAPGRDNGGGGDGDSGGGGGGGATPAALFGALLTAARTLPPRDLELAAGIVGLMAKQRGGGA